MALRADACLQIPRPYSWSSHLLLLMLCREISYSTAIYILI